MKVKAFSAIMAEVAELATQGSDYDQLKRLVADLKPFAQSELKGFFTLSSSWTDDPSATHAKGMMTVKQLAKAIGAAGRLLGAGGATAKGRELAAVANDLSPHGDVPVRELMDRVRAAQDEAKKEQIGEFAERLLSSQAVREKFEAVVLDLSKCAPDIVNAVAVEYVQGKSKYPSKPKALAAIRDKQYERARLASKMGER